MKALIIYLSVHHNNTEKVARVLAKALDADLLKVREADAAILKQYDLIGFGSGIYFGRHHKSLLNFVETLPVLKNKAAFIFSTSGLRKIQFIHNFDKPLKEKLKRKGFDIIGQFSCKGYDTYGALKVVGGINKERPNAQDLKQAEDFARGLHDKRTSSYTMNNYQA
ncbi:flavodoxin family protein [Candidatus Acetothermia bacterium]|jgi:flavodoxin|nr:flavodoxin family protein [Candidatus Acetothermia bacterium]